MISAYCTRPYDLPAFNYTENITPVPGLEPNLHSKHLSKYTARSALRRVGSEFHTFCLLFLYYQKIHQG